MRSEQRMILRLQRPLVVAAAAAAVVVTTDKAGSREQSVRPLLYN